MNLNQPDMLEKMALARDFRDLAMTAMHVSRQDTADSAIEMALAILMDCVEKDKGVDK